MALMMVITGMEATTGARVVTAAAITGTEVTTMAEGIMAAAIITTATGN